MNEMFLLRIARMTGAIFIISGRVPTTTITVFMIATCLKRRNSRVHLTFIQNVKYYLVNFNSNILVAF